MAWDNIRLATSPHEITRLLADWSNGDLDLVGLDDALESVAKMDARQSRLVELRFFAGLAIEETAEVLQMSPATAKRDWTAAKAWLFREIRRQSENAP